MSINEPQLAAHLAAGHHVTTRQRLLALGLTRHQIDGMLRSGRLVSDGNGVLRSPVPLRTLEQRAALACAQTGGAIAFPTAGRLWELRRTPREASLHVVVPWERRLTAPEGITLRRSRALPDRDVVTRPDGIAVTTPPRTVFDAAGWLNALDLTSMIEDGLYRGLFSVATLSRVVRRLGHPCRDGSRLIMEVLRQRDPATVPAASDYELRLERALIERGFPRLVRQHAIDLGGGRWVHPDLGLPDDGFFVEIDHRKWHDESEVRVYDSWRDRRARLLGFWVERVSDLAIDYQLPETVEELWAAWQRARRARRGSAA